MIIPKSNIFFHFHKLLSNILQRILTQFIMQVKWFWDYIALCFCLIYFVCTYDPHTDVALWLHFDFAIWNSDVLGEINSILIGKMQFSKLTWYQFVLFSHSILQILLKITDSDFYKERPLKRLTVFCSQVAVPNTLEINVQNISKREPHRCRMLWMYQINIKQTSVDILFRKQSDQFNIGRSWQLAIEVSIPWLISFPL